MTTKQTGHTPGIWRLYGELNIENPAGEYVCSCGQNGRIEVSKANAAFIVTACNSHEILLEACKEMYFELLAYQDKHPKIKSIDMVRWDQTISRAKGETQ